MIAQDATAMPTGVVAGKAYLVRYDENQWKRYDEAGRDFCKATWIKWATPLDVEHVVLQLVPDEFFPIHGNEQPYIEWQHRLDRTPPSGFTVETLVTFTVHTSGTPDPAVASNLRLAIGKLPKGTRWRALNLNQDSLGQGRA